jgi:hypothetical protein
MAPKVQLRIAVSDPGLAQSLASFLEHTIYRPAPAERGIVAVTGPAGLSIVIARAELDLYLEAWRRLHPGASASLID